MEDKTKYTFNYEQIMSIITSYIADMYYDNEPGDYDAQIDFYTDDNGDLTCDVEMTYSDEVR